MKIYAMRDTLIEYYLAPFLGPNDKEVLGVLARLVNQGTKEEPIYVAPHNFELWSFGEINEEGEITINKKRICQCDSLIRGNLREDPERTTNQIQKATPANGRNPPSTLRAGGTLEPFDETNVETKAGQAGPTHRQA